MPCRKFMKANLPFAVARIERNLFAIAWLLLGALLSGSLTNTTHAQPCAPAWSYYLDPVGPDRHVRSLATHGGLLYARGDWSMVAGAPANNVAVFNGTNWSGNFATNWPYSGSPAGNTVLVSYQGSLYAPLGGGSASSNYTIGAILSGGGWVGWPATGLWHNTNVVLNINRCWRAAVHQNSLFAAGTFFYLHPSGTGSVRRLFAEFDGASWHQMDGGYGPDTLASDRIESLVSHQGALYVGGLFSQLRKEELGGTNTPTPAANIARYSGGKWHALPNGGLNGRVYTMAVYRGDLYVGGDFTATFDGAISLLRIARLRNGAWERVGGGLAGSRPRSMVVADDGRGRALFIGATSGEANNAVPPTADTVPVSGLVRWNGIRYSALADGITGGTAVFAMARYDSGTGEALFVGADSFRNPDDLSFFGRTARWGPAPMVDSDGDGIFDTWETSGIDGDCDGTIDLPLPTMGANPQRKDIFVEIDAMNGRPVIAAAVADVVQAFASAPVANPSGPLGISLHLFPDENNLPLQHLPNGITDLHPLKRVHFGTAANRGATNSRAILDARARVFRYGILGDTYGNNRSSGVAELPGDDFLVTLGFPSRTQVLEGQYQSATIMHELGHNLGLYHGGRQIDWSHDRRYNYKPNYRSVMNYAWSFAWDRFGWALDYSTNTLPPLDESALIETNGVGAPYVALMIYGPPPAIPFFMDGPVDWNRNAVIDAGLVSADINVIETNGVFHPGDILHGAEDWSRLIYNFRNSPNYGEGTSVEDTETIDMDFTRDLADLTGFRVALSITREGNDVRITWSNATYTLQAATVINQWVDLPGVTSPATLSANLPYRFFRLIWHSPKTSGPLSRP